MNERNVTIVSIVVLVLVLLGGGGAIYYLHDALSVKETERSGLKAEVEDMQKKKDAIPDLEKQIAKLDAEIKKGQSQIPRLDELQYDEFADLIDNLRKLSNVFLGDARYSPGKTGGTGALPPSMNRATYDLNVKGGFFNLLRFINLLEAQKRHVGVQHFSIAEGAGDQKSAVPIREMRLTIFSFAQKPMNLPGMKPPTAEAVKAPEPEAVRKSTDLPN